MLQALLVEPKLKLGVQLASLFKAQGYSLDIANSPSEAMKKIGQSFPDVILVVLTESEWHWQELFENNNLADAANAILIDNHCAEETVGEAMRLGLIDYFTIPLDKERLTTVLQTLSDDKDDHHDPDRIKPATPCGKLIGQSNPMRRIYRLIRKVAPTNVSVLIQGESGTGKELVADAIHAMSTVADGPFLALNCGALPPQLLESELFGHVKGAFTGANRAHTGFFERADGGTLFLDEITEMDIELQVKLLRVLESKRFMKVGGEREQTANARVVAACNRPPHEAIADGKLREDLYYRLAQFPIRMPPLRERLSDTVLLAEHFLDQCNAEHGEHKTFSAQCLEAIQIRDWPGNVRELKNAIERAHILAESEIQADDLPEPLPLNSNDEQKNSDEDDVVILEVGSSLEEAERELLQATLLKYDGDKTRTAEALGVSVKTIYNMLKRHGIE